MEIIQALGDPNPTPGPPGDRKWRAVVAVQRSIRLDLPESVGDGSGGWQSRTTLGESSPKWAGVDYEFCTVGSS